LRFFRGWGDGSKTKDWNFLGLPLLSTNSGCSEGSSCILLLLEVLCCRPWPWDTCGECWSKQGAPGDELCSGMADMSTSASFCCSSSWCIEILSDILAAVAWSSSPILMGSSGNSFGCWTTCGSSYFVRPRGSGSPSTNAETGSESPSSTAEGREILRTKSGSPTSASACSLASASSAAGSSTASAHPAG